MTREEFIEASLDICDFVFRSTERFESDHPGRTKSDILRRCTLFPWLVRDTPAEREEFPPEAVEFLRRADVDWTGAMEQFRRELPALAGKNYAGAMAADPNFPPGRSVRADRPNPTLPRNWCIIHMWNAIRPKSFLKEERYFAECLLKTMDEAEKEYGFDTLYTFSWLNSVPRYLHFFPEEWQDNLGEPDLEIHANQGFLGQFINSRAGLNRRTAEQYLLTGELPFKPRKSHCSFAAARRHLQRFI